MELLVEFGSIAAGASQKLSRVPSVARMEIGCMQDHL